MSDPMTNVEIEDVLSSIRRLVSEDVRQARPKAALRDDGGSTARAETAPKLVLTPALRVPSPPDEVADDDIAQAWHGDAEADRVSLAGEVAQDETHSLEWQGDGAGPALDREQDPPIAFGRIDDGGIPAGDADAWATDDDRGDAIKDRARARDDETVDAESAGGAASVGGDAEPVGVGSASEPPADLAIEAGDDDLEPSGAMGWPGSRRSGGVRASPGADPADRVAGRSAEPWRDPSARLLDQAHVVAAGEIDDFGSDDAGPAWDAEISHDALAQPITGAGRAAVSVAAADGESARHGDRAAGAASLEQTIAELEAAVAGISGEFEPETGSAQAYSGAEDGSEAAPAPADVASWSLAEDDVGLDEPVTGGLSVSDWTLPWPTTVTAIRRDPREGLAVGEGAVGERALGGGDGGEGAGGDRHGTGEAGRGIPADPVTGGIADAEPNPSGAGAAAWDAGSPAGHGVLWPDAAQADGTGQDPVASAADVTASGGNSPRLRSAEAGMARDLSAWGHIGRDAIDAAGTAEAGPGFLADGLDAEAASSDRTAPLADRASAAHPDGALGHADDRAAVEDIAEQDRHEFDADAGGAAAGNALPDHASENWEAEGAAAEGLTGEDEADASAPGHWPGDGAGSVHAARHRPPHPQMHDDIPSDATPHDAAPTDLPVEETDTGLAGPDGRLSDAVTWEDDTMHIGTTGAASGTWANGDAPGGIGATAAAGAAGGMASRRLHFAGVPADPGERRPPRIIRSSDSGWPGAGDGAAADAADGVLAPLDREIPLDGNAAGAQRGLGPDAAEVAAPSRADPGAAAPQTDGRGGIPVRANGLPTGGFVTDPAGADCAPADGAAAVRPQADRTGADGAGSDGVGADGAGADSVGAGEPWDDDDWADATMADAPARHVTRRQMAAGGSESAAGAMPAWDTADRDAAEAEDNVFDTRDAADLDTDALRDLVAEIIRQELQGTLGERITRSVRKLVRREVNRILEARDLE